MYYTIYVAATNGQVTSTSYFTSGSSTYDNLATATTQGFPINPAAPTPSIPTLSGESQSSVMSWTAPSASGTGGAVTGYDAVVESAYSASTAVTGYISTTLNASSYGPTSSLANTTNVGGGAFIDLYVNMGTNSEYLVAANSQNQVAYAQVPAAASYYQLNSLLVAPDNSAIYIVSSVKCSVAMSPMGGCTGTSSIGTYLVKIPLTWTSFAWGTSSAPGSLTLGSVTEVANPTSMLAGLSCTTNTTWPACVQNANSGGYTVYGAMDASGNIDVSYVSSTKMQIIRLVAPSFTIATADSVYNSTTPTSSDYYSLQATVDPSGNLWLSDQLAGTQYFMAWSGSAFAAATTATITTPSSGNYHAATSSFPQIAFTSASKAIIQYSNALGDSVYATMNIAVSGGVPALTIDTSHSVVMNGAVEGTGIVVLSNGYLEQNAYAPMAGPSIDVLAPLFANECVISNPTTLSCQVTGLTNGEPVIGFYTASNATATSYQQWSQMGYAGAPPAGVAIASVYNTNTHSLAVTITPSADSWATSVTSYLVSVVMGGTPHVLCSVLATASSLACTGIDNYGTAVIGVTSTNANGTTAQFYTGSAENLTTTSSSSVSAQTITTPTQPSAVDFSQSVSVAATATSGLAVTYSVNGGTASGCSVSTAGVVTATSAGTCVIALNQAGNSSYSSAPAGSITVTFTAVAAVVTTPALAPVTPATPPTSNGASFAWQPSPSATNYQIVVTNPTGTVVDKATGTTPTVSATNLAPGTTYTATMYVYQNNGVVQVVSNTATTAPLVSSNNVAATVAPSITSVTGTVTAGQASYVTVNGTNVSTKAKVSISGAGISWQPLATTSGQVVIKIVASTSAAKGTHTLTIVQDGVTVKKTITIK
jgi:hypothetical protein